MSLPRLIRRNVLIRRNIASDLCTAVGCEQFCKESRKLQRIIMSERNYFFSFIGCCLVVALCPKNSISSILSKPKWGGGAQATVRGAQPPAPRSDGTGVTCICEIKYFRRNIIKRICKIQLSDECCENDKRGELVMCFYA